MSRHLPIQNPLATPECLRMLLEFVSTTRSPTANADALEMVASKSIAVVMHT
jgi:hypothetical protein